MKQWYFKENNIDSNINISFLCGSVYDRRNESDKRRVLKRYIESETNRYAIILEEYFDFSSNRNILGYDEILIRSLLDVEQLMALLADQIFIVHESISTAAELGMFGSNNHTSEKTCMIIPDENNVEEKKVSTYIKYAFGNININSITFYPKVLRNKLSESRSEYHTYFLNDIIGPNLSKKIQKFIKMTEQDELLIQYKPMLYGRINLIDISYRIDETNKKVYVNIPINILKSQIISMFNIDEFKSKLRNQEEQKVYSILNVVFKEYTIFLDNSIREYAAISREYNMSLRINELSSLADVESLKRSIGFVLYLLHSMKMISLPYVSGSKIKIHNKFKEVYSRYDNLIDEKEELSFLQGDTI